MKMNIICATDDKYIPYCGVMLTSLFENNKDLDITVFVLTDSLLENNVNDLNHLAEEYHNTIEIIRVNKEKTNSFPIWEDDHISIVTYYRLFIAELLPINVEKVLYLDCDIIVAKSLLDLWNTDITDYAVGAVTDSACFNNQDKLYVGITCNECYFCAGVLLINVDYWRENKLQEKFLDFVNKHKDYLRSHDQDTLNACLKDNVLYLPIVYHFQDYYLYTPFFNQYSDSFKQNIIATRKSDIFIYHLSACPKPLSCWHSVYPFDSEWKHYKKMSLWRHYPCTSSMKDRLMFAILRFCWKTGIKKIKVDFIEIQ